MSSVVSEVSTIGAKLAKLEAQLSALAKQFEGRKTGYASAIRPELERITTAFFQSETFTRLEDEIGKKYDSGVDLGVNVRELKSVFNRSINELAEQLIKQRVNSNLNLLLGLVFATLGIAVLGYVFYATYFSGTHAAEVADLRSFFVGFIPRIMFVILVESVAFFFLGLYREDRGMIRFFRNGMTNLEAKFIAFEASARFQDKAALAKAIAVFAATERNFTVKKGDRLITEVLREDDERLFAKFVDKLTSSFDSVNYVRNSYLKRERAGFPALSAPLDAPVQRMTTTRVPTRTRL